MLLNISPSWMVEGGIGTINTSGLFVASKKGTGKIIAVAGSDRGSADVTVTGPRPPSIWTVYVDPRELTATGGTVRFTVHAGDGDGIQFVKADIYNPDASVSSVDLTRTAGTERDGTWTATRAFPRNTAPYNSLGQQPDQNYDVRFRVRDKSGATTTSGRDRKSVV